MNSEAGEPVLFCATVLGGKRSWSWYESCARGITGSRNSKSPKAPSFCAEAPVHIVEEG